jgi:riboflavin synthase
MFTGLIEAVGKLLRAEVQGGESLLMIETPFADELVLGESVAVNGACLTATEMSDKTFGVFASSETMSKTTLGLLTPGDPVNLERAMRADGRLGGHIVTGHVDGIGEIADFVRSGSAWHLTIAFPEEMAPFIVDKGSIAIDGISLTVNTVRKGVCDLMIIPHTAESTTLGDRKKGDRINLESDLIGKYVYRMLAHRKPEEKSNISESFLAEHGFIK